MLKYNWAGRIALTKDLELELTLLALRMRKFQIPNSKSQTNFKFQISNFKIKKDVLLKNYTTFKIGGPAKYFFEAKDKKDLIKAILAAKKFKLPFFILGGGSNLLVADEGFKGLVIKIKNQKLKIKNKNKKSKIIEADGGTLLSQVVAIAFGNSLAGLEWAVGIPGTVGGAIRGNAGAFGSCMADLVESVEVLDIQDGKIPNSKFQIPNKFQTPNTKYQIKILKNRDCQFGYRESIFKRNKNLIILSATFQLKKGNKKKIQEKMKEYLSYRKENQPLNFPSAGSIFKNPSGFSAGRPKGRASPSVGELGEEDKSSSSPFAAARLIEECGLKGKRIGNVKISEKHANFIVNLGRGKAKDVKKLINLAKKKVKKKFGIELEEEICYLGFKK